VLEVPTTDGDEAISTVLLGSVSSGTNLETCEWTEGEETVLGALPITTGCRELRKPPRKVLTASLCIPLSLSLAVTVERKTKSCDSGVLNLSTLLITKHTNFHLKVN
jgi:hypothetical protein